MSLHRRLASKAHLLALLLSLSAPLPGCDLSSSEERLAPDAEPLPQTRPEPQPRETPSEPDVSTPREPWLALPLAPLPSSPHLRIIDGQRGPWLLRHDAEQTLSQHVEGEILLRDAHVPFDFLDVSLFDVQLFEARDGELWVGLPHGELWRSPEAGQWQRIESPRPGETMHLTRLWEQEGAIYLLESEAPESLDVRLWRLDGAQWRLLHQKAFMIIDYLPVSPERLFHVMQYGFIERSEDAGQTWEPLPHGPTHVRQAQLLLQGDALHAVTDHGLWRSDALGEQWEQRLDLRGRSFLLGSDERLWVRSADDRTLSSHTLDAPHAFTQAPILLPAPLQHGRLVTAWSGGVLIQSSDARELVALDEDTRRWQTLTPAPDSIAAFHDDGRHLYLLTEPGEMFLAEQEGWRSIWPQGVLTAHASTDHLMTLTTHGSPLFGDEDHPRGRLTLAARPHPRDLLVSDGERDHWISARDASQSFVSDLERMTWQPAPSPLPEMLRFDTQTTWGARSRWWLLVDEEQVWSTRDAGQSWHHHTLPEPSCPTPRASSPGRVTLGTSLAYFTHEARCTTQTTLWRQREEAAPEKLDVPWPPEARVLAMSVAPDDSSFVVSIEGHGLWHSDDQGASFSAMPLDLDAPIRALHHFQGKLYAASRDAALIISK